MNVYEQLADPGIIRRVNEVFYEKVYNHPWLSKFFAATNQEHITNQQTDFITAAVGGPKLYMGRFVQDAHPHIMIDDEVYDTRSELLDEALREVGAPEILADKWRKIDQAFRKVLVKGSIDECVRRYKTDSILDVPVSQRRA